MDELAEIFKHFDFCPICRDGLDTGLECNKCGADWMPLCDAVSMLPSECDALRAQLALSESVASAASTYSVAFQSEGDCFDEMEALEMALKPWREQRTAMLKARGEK